MSDSKRTAWNSLTSTWEPITDQEFGQATELVGRPLDTAAPQDGDAYIWSAVQQKWVPGAVGGGQPSAHASTHESGGGDAVQHDNLTGAGTATHAQLDAHVGSQSNPHNVDATQAGAEPSGAVAAHDTNTGVHGVGASTGESAAASQARVDSHGALTVNTHGVTSGTIESTVGAQSRVDAHDVTTGVHGVGGSTVESASGAQSKVDTHAAVAASVHGFDSQGAAPPQSHNNTAHSVAFASESAVNAHIAAVDNTHGEQVAVTSSDQSRTTTSWAYISGLGITLDKNVTYEFEATLYYTTDDNGTGLNLGVNGPSSPSSVVARMVTATSSTVVQNRILTSYLQTGIAFNASIKTGSIAKMTGIITVGGTSGNFQPVFATDTSGQGETVTIKAGSVFRVRKIG
jgi:hypothetical protein